MSDKDKKKKVGAFTSEEIAAISERNLSGKGWTESDFGVTSQFGPAPASTQVNPLGVVPPGVNSRFSDQKDQEAIRRVLGDNTEAAAAQGPVDAAKSFFGKVFDTSDTWTPQGFRYEGNPVESVWDSLWAGLGWVTDRINQGASWAQSAAPGGPETFTWEQAGQVSVGQAAMTANAQLGRQVYEQTGGGIIGGAIGAGAMAGLSLLNPLGMAARMSDSYAAADFDILDPEQRKQAFEESTYGKVASGVTDGVFTTVADPTVIFGKASSVAKLKYLDDTFRGEGGLARLQQQFIESADKPLAQKAPIAQFAALSAQVDPVTGKKVLSQRQIARRLSGATGQEMITSALYHNTDEKTAELILRYTFNDIEAGKALLDRRPAIGMAIMQKQRQRMSEILARDPSKKTQLANIALNAEKKIDDQLARTPKDSQDYARLLDAKNRAQETYAAIVDDKLHELTNGAGGSPEITALLAREHKDLIAHDRSLAKFIDDENLRVSTSANAFAGSTKGFARNTALGRAIERSRMRRVKAGAAAEAVRGAVVGTGKMLTLEDGTQVEKMTGIGWKSDLFGQNGFTRAVRVWRWFGEENPQGFIITKGEGAMGSWKAVKAALDDVDIYSGDARKVIIQQEVKGAKTQEVTLTVGGAQRKEQLLGMYMDAVNDTTAGADAAQIALARIEDAMFSDIAAWHGMSKKFAEDLRNKAMTKREGVLSGLRDKEVGFWIDEDGVQNKAPWLESQIQNGTYMLNYRAFNRLARLYDENGIIKAIDTGQQFIGKNAKFAYDLFNEMWRPAVLLRLGYTQRNVAEGLLRATAYTFSIDPIRFALVQGLKNTPRNTAVKWALRPAQKKAEAAARLRAAGNSSIKMPASFNRWLAKEIDANDTAIAGIETQITTPGSMIWDTSPEARDFMVNYYKQAEARYIAKHDAAKAAGAGRDELDQLLESADEARKQIDIMERATTFTGETDQSIATLAGLQLSARNLDYMINQRAALDNELSAAAMFRNQAGAKNRVMNGTLVAPDGSVLAEAFNPSNPYTPVALSNLSADATTKSMSIASSDTLQNAFKAYRMKTYVEVRPTDKNYYDGVASVLRQIKYSEIGSMAINGKSADEIADFLYKTQDGREIMKFIVNGENRLIRQRNKYDAGDLLPMNRETALEIAEQTIDRYKTIAPDPDLQNYLRTATLNEKFDGKVVRPFLDKRGPDGKRLYELKPVIGNIAEEMGASTVRDFINTITSTGMKWLGTFPEDAFVRAPFYGQRYRATLDDMIGNLQRQLGPDGKISIAEYDVLMRTAHRRALKDTKEWLFTIERRTNLGTYGEIAVPFISATQNTVTTVGRLIWKDPSILPIAVKIWQAPEKLGYMDDEGNLIFPVPHNLIPDGIEKALGIENLRSFKIGLNQINLIAPQLGLSPSEGALQIPPLFQFGPVVGVPASLFMRFGLFNMPDVPTPLKMAFGEEKSSLIWETWKDWTFGPEGGMNPQVWETIFPATWKRVVQFLQKNDNKQFARIYNANLHTEWLKYQGGLRDTPPSPEEITNMTNNLTILQFIMNGFSPAPPQYEQKLQVIVDEYRRIDDMVKANGGSQNDTDRMFADQYGYTLLVAKDLGMSRGYAPSTIGMVEAANKYAPLINRIAPELKDAGYLGSLGMLFSDNPEAVFDGSIYAWQTVENIPGTTTTWRERLSPEEAMLEDSKGAGWTKYLQFMEGLKARAAQMGVKSISDSPQLQSERDNFIVGMAGDPMYRAWFNDWQDFGSQRTTSTVLLMQAALTDQAFMEDHAQSPVWSAASQYLDGRAYVLNRLAESGGEITSLRNLEIKRWWDDFRSGLENTNPDWAVFANRWLDGDDNPQNPGVSFGVQMVGER